MHILWSLWFLTAPLQAAEPQKHIVPACPAEYARLTTSFRLSTDAESLERDYHDRIRPFFDSVPVHETMGTGDIPLKYRVFPAQTEKEIGSIVVAHGYTESMKGWAETVFNLTENGYRVYMFDYRGHGETPRLTEHPLMVYTDRFRDYVEDMSLFVDSVVKKDSHRRLGLLGYSMGGLISAMYASENPGTFSRVGLAAPMMGVRLKGVPPIFVEIAAKLMSRLGYAKRYALGQSEKWIEQPFGLHTHSPQRYHLMNWQAKAEPEIQTGGASFGWVATALEAVKQRNKIGRASTDNTLVVIGARDQVIPERDILKFCRRHQDCKIHYVDGGHSLFQEVDPVRRDLILRMMTHFASTPEVNESVPSAPYKIDTRTGVESDAKNSDGIPARNTDAGPIDGNHLEMKPPPVTKFVEPIPDPEVNP